MAAKRRAGDMTVFGALWRVSRPGVAVIVFFSLFINLLKFATPLYLLQVLDRVPASRSVETLIMLTVVALVAVAAGYALDIVRRKMLIRWGVWLEGQLGPKVVQRGLAGVAGEPDTVEVEAALADVSHLRVFLSKNFSHWLDLIWSPVFVFGVFLIHPNLGMVTLSSIALLIVLGILMERSTRESRNVSGDAGREAGEVIRAAGRNRESVGALSLGRYLTSRWNRAKSGWLAERSTIEERLQVFRVLMRGLSEVMRIGVIAVGIWLVLAGTLTLGGIFAARVMAGFGHILVERALRNWRQLRRTIRSYRNLSRFLGHETTGSVTLPSDLETADFVVDGVSFRHPKQPMSLFRDLSFTLGPGEMLLISGQAATGKTTLSRLLMGLLVPRAGTVRLGDIEVSKIPEEIREHLFGYLPQHTELFDGTVLENIGRFGQGTFTEAVDAAKLVGLHNLIVGLPGGYDYPVHLDAFKQLSGSQRKRIAMARAVLGRPRLIVLDEPSANLDSPSRRVLVAALAELKAAGSTIVVTQSVHSSRLSALADKHLILGAGPKDADIIGKATKEGSAKVKSILRSVK